jgi:hypothetical protein
VAPRALFHSRTSKLYLPVTAFRTGFVMRKSNPKSNPSNPLTHGA